MDSKFYKLCRKIVFLSHPEKPTLCLERASENIEVYSSFRPSVSATISAEKLQQILVSSESDLEPEESEEGNEELLMFLTETVRNTYMMYKDGKTVEMIAEERG